MDVHLRSQTIAFHQQHLFVEIAPQGHLSGATQSFMRLISFRKEPKEKFKYSFRASFPIRLPRMCSYSISVSALVSFLVPETDYKHRTFEVVIPLEETRISLAEVLEVSEVVKNSPHTEELHLVLPLIEGNSDPIAEVTANLERLQRACDDIDGIGAEVLCGTLGLKLTAQSKEVVPSLLQTTVMKLNRQHSSSTSGATEPTQDFVSVEIRSSSLQLLSEIHSECCESFLKVLKDESKAPIPEFNESHKFSAPREVQEMLSESNLLVADLSVSEDLNENLLETCFRRVFGLYKKARARTF